MLRLLSLALISGFLIAQQPAAPPPAAAQDQQPTFTVGTDYVSTPVLVFDRNNNYVAGIRADQFRLFDNGREQNIQVDVTFTPISLVICVQANSNVQGLLPQVKKMEPDFATGSGDQGEVALIAYDHRIRVLQDFTSDANLVTEQVKKISPGSSSSRMVDAVVEGTRMLSTRPKSRRRIMLVIGETRDIASENRAREALVNLQLSNVLFYAVDMSRFMTTLTAPPPVGRPDPLPPAMHPLPAGVPSTPTTVAQAYGTNGGRAEFIPLLLEIYRDAKAIFKSNPIEVFTRGTGGTEFGFHSQRTLEEAISKVGEELHSDYTITYSPNNRGDMGFHEIVVDVTGRADVKSVRARPGYWLGPKAAQ